MKNKWKRDAVAWSGQNVMEAPPVTRTSGLTPELIEVRRELLINGANPRQVARHLRDEYGVETNWKAHAAVRCRLKANGLLND